MQLAHCSGIVLDMTQGWQNLSAERHRIRGQENILFEIQRSHPTAFMTPVGDEFAYWIGTADQPRLVGIAWRPEDSDYFWCYAFMNEIAVEIGVRCTLVHHDGKNVIMPGSLPGVFGVVNEKPQSVVDAIVLAGRFKGEPESVHTSIGEQALASVVRESAAKASRPVVVVQPAGKIGRRVFRENGQFWVRVETKTHVRELGPFPDRDAAAKAKV